MMLLRNQQQRNLAEVQEKGLLRNVPFLCVYRSFIHSLIITVFIFLRLVVTGFASFLTLKFFWLAV
jgi:hypothetical protein